MTRSKILMPVGGVIVLAVLAGAFVFSRQADAPSPAVIPTNSSAAQTSSETHTRSTPDVTPKGQYLSYSPGIIEKTSGTKVLFFHAPWCPQCRAIEASIIEQGVPDGVAVIKVDYDTNNDLRKQYGVTLQTTFVRVNDKGELISKYVAYNEPTFDSVRRELL